MSTEALIEAEAGNLTDAELHRLVGELELLNRKVQSALAAAVGEVDRRGAYGDDGHVSVMAYQKARLNSSGTEASQRRSIAAMLHEHSQIETAWAAGYIGRAQVDELLRAHRNRRVSEQFGRFVDDLLVHAEQLSCREFTQVIDRFLQLADADGAHDDRDTAVEHRNAHVLLNGGELDIAAVGGDALTATEMQQIHRSFCEDEYRADIAARAAEHGDVAAEHDLPRSARQRRFDALLAIFRAASAHRSAGLGPATPAVPVLNVVIDERSFNHMLADAGLANQPSDDLLGDPEQLLRRHLNTSEGEAVTHCDALRAALTGHIRRVVVNSSGVPIDWGRRRRLFTGAAREAAQLLITSCEHPGCELPTDFCQVDHNIEWCDGGLTDQANAGNCCPGHNGHKHRHQWRFRTGCNGKRYKLRRDGTIELPVGARAPALIDDRNDPEVAEAEQYVRDRLARDVAACRSAA